MRNILTPMIFLALLCGCQKAGDSDEFDSSLIKSEISIKATSELLPGYQVTQSSFAPKKFANWLSQILLLNDTGQVFSTNTGFGGVETVSNGRFQDLVGLSRGDDPSIFLAIAASGDLKAFIEDDTGDNFKPFTFSSSEQKYSNFCQMEVPDSQFFFAVSDDGKLIKTAYSAGNELLELTNTEVISTQQIKACVVSKLGQIYIVDDENKVITIAENGDAKTIKAINGFDQISPVTFPDQTPALFLMNSAQIGLFLWDGQEVRKLNIVPGLSIDGIERPAWVNTTSSAMGSTFNNGLTLVGDSNSSRVVMISNEYLIRELQKTSD